MSQTAVAKSIVNGQESETKVNRLPRNSMSKTSSPAPFDSACAELENLGERLTNLVRSKTPKRILIAPTDDLFAKSTATELQDIVLLTAFQNPLHQFQILTAQPENARKFLAHEKLLPRLEKQYKKTLEEKKTLSLFAQESFEFPFSNLLFGVNIEHQKQVPELRPALQEIAASGWKTWLSYDAAAPVTWSAEWKFLRWLVIGGESEKTARPVHPGWLRTARDFAAKNKKMSFFFRGWGDWLPKQIWEESPESKKSSKKWNQFEWGAITLNGDFHRLSLPNPRRSKDECLVLKVGKAKSGNSLDGETFVEFL